MPQRKILVLDIESAPDLDKVLEIFPSLSDYPGKTLRATINTMICFGYKWHGEMDKAKCLNVWDYSEDINDDKKLCKMASELIHEADAVVTHNGKKFDWKFIQTRLLKHGLPPIPKIPHIDTCQVARSNLIAYNNRLNTIGELTGSGQKLSHEGWDLWVKTVRGNKTARKKMSDYCKQDVDLLDEIFKKLLPLTTGLPNANLFSEFEKDQCPKCESTRMKRHGNRYTATAVWQRWLCLACGGTHSTPKDTAIHR